MCLLYCACHAKFIFPDPLQMPHACHRFWNCYKTRTFCSLLIRCTIPCACHAKRHVNVQKCSVPLSFLHFWLWNVLRATTACTFSTSQLPKVVRSQNMVCFVHFDLEASCHDGVHFFDISTSKSGPTLMCFDVFCTFWLGHVLRATTACSCSSLIWPAGSAPAALASLLFDPPEPQINGKTQCFATFLPFRAPASSFFSLFLFFDLLSSPFWLFPPLLFHVSVLSEVWLLNFLRLHLPPPIPGYWSYIQGPTLNCLLPWIPPLHPIIIPSGCKDGPNVVCFFF